MNIALATLTLLVILYPGFLFRRFYYSSEFSKEYFKQSITDLIFSSILPGFFIHFIGYLIFIKGRTNLDIDTIGTLLSGTADAGRISKAFGAVYQNSTKIVLYFLAVSVIGIGLGFTAKYLVRKFKLDRKYKLFRFQNEWHYIFSSEILDFPKVAGKAEEASLSYIDALVQTAEGTVIYSGLLSDYILTKDGGIDRIYLSDVKRRFLKDDATEKEGQTNEEQKDERYYFLPGQFFILPYSSIINLHITYYQITVNPELRGEIEEVDIE